MKKNLMKFWKNKKRRELFGLNLYTAMLFIFFMLLFGVFLFGLAGQFKMVLSFGSAQHNIDLAFNMANIGCDFCLSDIYDEGVKWDGEQVVVSLKDSYIQSMNNTRKLMYFSNIGAFILGLLLAGLVGLIQHYGEIAEKLRSLERGRK